MSTSKTNHEQPTPRHDGPNTFPNDYFFGTLVRSAYRDDLIAIRDITFGYEATYQQFLTDVLYVRNLMRNRMPQQQLEATHTGEGISVGLIGPGGYEFVVGFFALMAFGAVIVPLAPGISSKEALHLVQTAKISSIVTPSASLKVANEISELISRSTAQYPMLLDIGQYLMQPPLPVDEFIVSSGAYSDPNRPGYIIFTSGTSGPPKGCVMRRGAIYDVAVTFSHLYNIRGKDTTLHTLPVHHATGIHISLLPFLVSGACIEFRSGPFRPEELWDRIRESTLHYFSGVPTMYSRLMDFYETSIVGNPNHIVSEYVTGLRKMRALVCGSAALPRSLQQKWTDLRQGRPILTRYGGTEFGVVFWTPPSDPSIDSASVGRKFPGVEVKMNHSGEGGLLVKSALGYSHYIGDSAATAASFDVDGYFATGDIAHKSHDEYFIDGRLSVDILKSGGYKISALDIEREITGLSYVSDAAVVGVEDAEYGQRVAAVISLRQEVRQSLTIGELRDSLRSVLTGYKLPTVLRIVSRVPRNATHKVNKRELVKRMFPAEGHPDIQIWRSARARPRL
ncbi:Malonate--CoA ligase ACSF3, mitochondrial [Pseudocercospora fuligena]|uniref:Malonate--CoA ligase ACSF3, mitochondrial n=1 Tax=Pseudocercospora fuligena TaxID=685502 RepID=A0A8H6RN06_9PEZI|nr:Malonate--CoA ligase ACSF3, mitochondrial [Pseudocercospora fuligena]